jgi:hypothetical protein
VMLNHDAVFVLNITVSNHHIIKFVFYFSMHQKLQKPLKYRME